MRPWILRLTALVMIAIAPVAALAQGEGMFRIHLPSPIMFSDMSAPTDDLVVVLQDGDHENLDLRSQFSPEDWASDLTKRFVIPADARIGSTNPNAPAMTTNTGWGGDLVVQNLGTIIGAGGHPNGGTGGTAIDIEQDGVILINDGHILGGGGGGGRGGDGGEWSQTTNVREPQSGYTHENNRYGWLHTPDPATERNLRIRWSSSGNLHEVSKSSSLSTFLHPNGCTYHRGTLIRTVTYVGSPAVWSEYSIYRTCPQTTSSPGGTGGDGGMGEGYANTATSGLPGASGTEGSGAGGRGGDGGNIGSNGDAGTAGADSIATGQHGYSGGDAGYAIRNASRASIVDNGVVQGR